MYSLADVASLKSIIPNSDLSEILYQKLFTDSNGIVNELPDSSFSASQSYSNKHGPENCRIGAAKKGDNTWAWCAKANGDCITIDLLKTYLITGISTQARGDSAQWISKEVTENA